MAFNKLVALEKGNPLNSTGADVAAAVNGLIDVVGDLRAKPVGNRFRLMSRKFSQAADKNFTFGRFVTFAPNYRGTKLILAYTNWYVISDGSVGNVETNNDNAITIDGACVWVDGTPYIAKTSSGETSATISAGETLFMYVDAKFKPFNKLMIDTASSVADSAQTLGAVMRSAKIGDISASGDASYASLIGVSAPTDNASANRNNTWYPFSPSCVFAETAECSPVKAPLVTGDSIAVGANEMQIGAPYNGACGYIDRAYASHGIPTLNMAVSGSRPSQALSDAVWTKRFAIIDAVSSMYGGKLPFDYILDEYIVNDMGGSVTLSTLNGYKSGFAAMIKGKYPLPLISTTNTPRASGANTYDYSTAASQTITAGNGIDESRWTYYGNLLGNYFNMNIDGVIDVSKTCVNTAAKDKWATGDGYSGTVSTTTTANSTTSVKLSRTGGDIPPKAGDVICLSAGTASAENVIVKNCVVESASVYAITIENRNGFNVTINAHTAGNSAIAVATSDGLHPSSTLHEKMALAMVDGAKSLGLL